MAIYGNVFLKEQDNFNDIDSIFFNEVNRISSLIEFTIDTYVEQQSILEGNELSTNIDYSAGPITLDTEEKDKSEKSNNFIQKIINFLKGLFVKFVEWFKNLIAKVSEWLKKTYEKIRDNTIRDKILSSFSKLKNLTFNHLAKAKEAGWEGIPYSNPCISPAIFVDLKQFQITEKNSELKDDIKDFYKKIEEIQSENEEEKAAKLLDDLKEMKSDLINKNEKEHKSKGYMDTLTHNGFKQLNEDIQKNLDAMFNMYEKRIPVNKLLFIAIDFYDNAEKKTYIPNEQSFNILKDWTLNGQKNVADRRKDFESNFVVPLDRQIKQDIEFVKRLDLNKSPKIDSIKIKALVIKTQFALHINHNMLSELVNILKFQSNVAIRTYLTIVKGVKKFVAIE